MSDIAVVDAVTALAGCGLRHEGLLALACERFALATGDTARRIDALSEFAGQAGGAAAWGEARVAALCRALGELRFPHAPFLIHLDELLATRAHELRPWTLLDVAEMYVALELPAPAYYARIHALATTHVGSADT